MSKAKKLNLTMPELVGIAQAINKNTITNKSRSKDKKINTDTFIRQFGINRKNFSETIKDTDINYNKSTFQYVSDGLNNGSDTLATPTEKLYNNNDDTIVVPNKSKHNNNDDTIVVKNKNIETNVAIVEFENMKSGLSEMLEWYKVQKKKENIIDIEIPIIHIDKEKLTELAVTRGFKVYPSVIVEFKEFCKQNSQYTMQDLMAMSMKEYMIKYKNK